MILETWWLTMNEQCDPAARVSYTVYNRMAVMLKSLFCVSRVTPAYRLSRRQGPETFVICYRMYLGAPQYGCLGENHKIIHVGKVPSPAGTITLSVACRTKMLISPHQSCKDLAADLKDDHFKSDVNSPRCNSAKPCHIAFRDHRCVCFIELLIISYLAFVTYYLVNISLPFKELVIVTLQMGSEHFCS